MKEKIIEKWIVQYLQSIGAIVEWMQGWKAMIKKWKKTYKMNLQSEWCPDIICFYKREFIWIEVKRDQEEVDSWVKLKERFLEEWFLPKSYKREENQIIYSERILEQWGSFIITCDLEEVINFIEEL